MPSLPLRTINLSRPISLRHHLITLKYDTHHPPYALGHPILDPGLDLESLLRQIIRQNLLPPMEGQQGLCDTRGTRFLRLLHLHPIAARRLLSRLTGLPRSTHLPVQHLHFPYTRCRLALRLDGLFRHSNSSSSTTLGEMNTICRLQTALGLIRDFLSLIRILSEVWE